MKKTYIFSFLYFSLILLLLKGFIDKNSILQLISKICLFLTLITTYITTVSNNNWNKLYIGMTITILIGQLFFINPESYFSYSLYSYFIAHFLFAIMIYTKFLKNKSSLDIFTFSLPFLLTFSAIYIMLEGLDFWWNIKIIAFAPAVCFNATIALLNYITRKNTRNYLFFIATTIWIIVDALATVYMFNLREDLYYAVVITLDAIVQYLICRGVMLDNSHKKKLFIHKVTELTKKT